MLEAIGPEDIAGIMRALVEKAKAGDIAAAKVVLERVFGRVTDTETAERLEALEAALLERPIVRERRDSLTVDQAREVLTRHGGASR